MPHGATLGCRRRGSVSLLPFPLTCCVDSALIRAESSGGPLRFKHLPAVFAGWIDQQGKAAATVHYHPGPLPLLPTPLIVSLRLTLKAQTMLAPVIASVLLSAAVARPKAVSALVVTTGCSNRLLQFSEPL